MADYDNPRPSSQELGSTELVVAKDNLITHDLLTNTTDETVTNRKGRTFRSLAGNEKAFDDSIAAKEAEAKALLDKYRESYIGDYVAPDKTFTTKTDFVQWAVGDGGDGNTYVYIGPESGLPYTTNVALYGDPNDDPNLQIENKVNSAQLNTTVNAGDSLVAGGLIYPPENRSAELLEDLTGVSFVKLKGGDFPNIFRFALVDKTGSLALPSGTLDTINLTVRPYSVVIGGTDYYIVDASKWAYICNNLCLDALFPYLDGVNDDAILIRAASEVAGFYGVEVSWGPHTYSIKSEIIIDTPWKGVEGVTRVQSIAGFSHGETQQGLTYSRGWNKGYRTDGYDDATANTVVIEGIIFDRQETDPAYTHWFTFRNVKGGVVSGNGFTHTDLLTTSMTHMNFDGACRNVKVKRNNFKNATGETTGTDVGVRNLSTNYTDPENACSGIKIYNNYSLCASGDEVYIIYAVFGLVKDCEVKNNTIDHSTEGNGALISIISDASSPTYEPYAITRDVIVEGNTCNTTASLGAVVRVGRGTDLDNNVRNVKVDKNTVNITPFTGSVTNVFFKEKGTNVTATNNTVNISQGAVNIQSCYKGFDSAIGNKIYDFATSIYAVRAFDACLQSEGNTISANPNAITTSFYNCTLISGNKATNATLSFNNSVSGVITNNECTINDTGVARTMIQAQGSTNANVSDNRLFLNNLTEHSPYFFNTTGEVNLTDNKIFGTGKYPSQKPTHVSNNTYYGTSDSFSEDTSLPFDLRNSLPNGHVIQKITKTVDGNNSILMGWYITGSTMNPYYAKSISV